MSAFVDQPLFYVSNDQKWHFNFVTYIGMNMNAAVNIRCNTTFFCICIVYIFTFYNYKGKKNLRNLNTNQFGHKNTIKGIKYSKFSYLIERKKT